MAARSPGMERALLLGLLVASCVPVSAPPRVADPGYWPCASRQVDRMAEERILVLRSAWRLERGQPVRTWGVDLSERGATDIILVRPGTSTAVTAGRGIGATAAPLAPVIARFALENERRTGIEILDGSTLERMGLVSGEALRQRAGGAFADATSALTHAVLAAIDARRLLVVQASQGLPGDPPAFIDAVCIVDGTVVGRRALRSVEDGLEPCGFRPQVALRGGEALITYPICASVKGTDDPSLSEPVARLFRLTTDGGVRYFDLPVRRAVAPVGVDRNGDRVYVANPLTQEIYAVAGDDGRTLWRTGYGTRPSIRSPLKYAPAPNSIVVAPDGKRIFVVTNPGAHLANGIFIIDASTGRTVDHVAGSLSVSGIAMAATGVLYISTPERGGALYSLRPEAGATVTLVEDGLGDEVSGVLVSD